MRERLQKILAHAGIASRRHAEEIIQAGRVTVNGHRMTELGSKADPDEDVIKVDGKRVRSAQRDLDRLRGGAYIDNEWLAPSSIERLKSGENPWLEVTLHQGKNQQIRRMFQSIGHPVEKLRRVRIGSLEDQKLKPGAWRFLTAEEVNQLRREFRK